MPYANVLRTMFWISAMSVESLMETVELDWDAFAIQKSVVSAPLYTKVAVWSLFCFVICFWSFSCVICGVQKTRSQPFGNILFSMLSSIFFLIFIFKGTWTFTWSIKCKAFLLFATLIAGAVTQGFKFSLSGWSFSKDVFLYYFFNCSKDVLRFYSCGDNELWCKNFLVTVAWSSRTLTTYCN